MVCMMPIAKFIPLLKYGAKVKETADGAPKTVYFMDIETPTNNDFAIAEEVTVVDHRKETRHRNLCEWYCDGCH